MRPAYHMAMSRVYKASIFVNLVSFVVGPNNTIRFAVFLSRTETSPSWSPPSRQATPSPASNVLPGWAVLLGEPPRQGKVSVGGRVGDELWLAL